MRCTGTTAQGTRCRWPSDRIVAGLAVCAWHTRQAERLGTSVRASMAHEPEATRRASILRQASEYRSIS
jgi:hypothetical protein